VSSVVTTEAPASAAGAVLPAVSASNDDPSTTNVPASNDNAASDGTPGPSDIPTPNDTAQDQSGMSEVAITPIARESPRDGGDSLNIEIVPPTPL
jgi:hypothetical protein